MNVSQNVLARAWAASALALAATILYLGMEGLQSPMDVGVQQWVAAHVPAPVSHTWFAGIVSFPADTATMGVAVAAGAALLLLWRRRGDAFWLAGTAVAGFGLVSALKDSLHRARPTATLVSGSLPSGHATAIALDGGLLVVLVAGAWLDRQGRPRTLRPWLAAWVALSLLVGAARVLGAVHWVTDVVAGWSLGALLLCTSLWLREVARARLRTTAPAPA
jgi:undecaprenyl-diphosphatase